VPGASTIGWARLAAYSNWGSDAGNGVTVAVTAATTNGASAGPEPVSAKRRISNGLAPGFGTSSNEK